MAGVESPPFAMQNASHGAQLFRLAMGAFLGAPQPIALTSPLTGPVVGVAPTQGNQQTANTVGGVLGLTDFNITQNGTPNMSVNVAGGQIMIPGGSVASQGLYYGLSDAVTNIAISASDPTNPRIDTIIASVADAAYSGGSNNWTLGVAAGVATSGATLTNLTGANNLASYPNCVVLGYVLVGATVTSILTAAILNAQPLCSPGFNGLPTRGTPVCRAYRNAAFTNANTGGFQICPMDTVVFDNCAGFNTTTHVYTCPTAGYYQVNGIWNRSGGLAAGHALWVSIYKNGAVWGRGTYCQWTANGPALSSVATDIVKCAAGDTLALWYEDWGGGAINTGNVGALMSVARVAT